MTFEAICNYLHLQWLPLSSINVTTSVPYLSRHLHCLQWHKHLHLQFCTHNTGTSVETQVKSKVFTYQNKQAAVPLPNRVSNLPCVFQAGIPSHSCFQSCLTQSGKGIDASLQEGINTRAEGWMRLKRKLKAEVFSEHLCKCPRSALPSYQGCQPCSNVRESSTVLFSH